MNKSLAILVIILVVSLGFASRANAMMIGPDNKQITNSEIQAQQQEEREGKVLLDKLNSKSVSCQELSNEDFDKIGEYFMGVSIGDTEKHVEANNRMKAMMGESGEEQTHINWGKRGSNCEANRSFANWGGGVFPMMSLYGSGMNWGSGWGIFETLGFIIWIVVLVDLILLGVWLWKQIQKK